MKKKLFVCFFLLLLIGHVVYFVLWPMIGWKPFGTLDNKEIEYIKYLDYKKTYSLSEEEMSEFVEQISQLRIHWIPGDIDCEYWENTYWIKCRNEKEVKIHFEYPLFVYDGKAYHVDGKYYELLRKMWIWSSGLGN